MGLLYDYLNCLNIYEHVNLLIDVELAKTPILSNQLCAMWYLFSFGLRNRFIDVCGSFSKKKKA